MGAMMGGAMGGMQGQEMGALMAIQSSLERWTKGNPVLQTIAAMMGPRHHQLVRVAAQILQGVPHPELEREAAPVQSNHYVQVHRQHDQSKQDVDQGR
jgi:hypothetical protein